MSTTLDNPIGLVRERTVTEIEVKCPYCDHVWWTRSKAYTIGCSMCHNRFKAKEIPRRYLKKFQKKESKSSDNK